jgi:hypothetical protein
MRRLVTLSLFLASFACSLAAAAAPGARECIAAHAEGQELQKKGSLLAARSRFLACAAEACPAMIRGECEGLAKETDAATPTVLPVAMTEAESEALGATVEIDGKHVSALGDGRALPLDPGTHQFLFKLADGRTQLVKATLHEGEKYRRVEARFGASPAPSAPRGIHPLTYVFGGLGVAAAGSFTYFALDGKASENRTDRCAPRCTEAVRGDLDDMRRSYLIADVSLAVSLVSLGLGTYFLLKGPPESDGNTSGSSGLPVYFDARLGRSELGVTTGARF